MLDYSNSNIERLAVHYVGNKIQEESLALSEAELTLYSAFIKEKLIQYFLTPFNSNEFYSFVGEGGSAENNPLFAVSSDIFSNPSLLLEKSQTIAERLYDITEDGNIKSGEVFVVYFTNMIVDDELTDAIGIFKSEKKQAFLKIAREDNNYTLDVADAINIDKLDKGCLIFNSFKEDGYKISFVDKYSRGVEAKFWKDTFLSLKSLNNEFYKTNEFLKITKNFVAKQMPDETHCDKTEQIEILHRSMDYFNERDTFNKEEFEQEVFKEPELIKSFRKFDDGYRVDNAISMDDEFQISAQAVKKQARAFSGVLKLDKNFHIYIHGNSELIRKGEEKDGRKYYKFYFQNEE